MIVLGVSIWELTSGLPPTLTRMEEVRLQLKGHLCHLCSLVLKKYRSVTLATLDSQCGHPES